MEPHAEYTNLRIWPALADAERDQALATALTEVGIQLGGEYQFNFNGKLINVNNYDMLKKHFKIVDNTIIYDNLICLAMIVKDAGANFENILKANIPFIDRWCILDTGSTDGTQETIKRVLSGIRGELFEEPFVNFKVSRNRCLELAGKTCKFIIMLDDTYILKGDIRSFLNEVRGDQFSESFSLMIKSDDTEYYSNRVVKSEKNLKYIYSIHEVIDFNINVTIPSDKAYILDHRSDYMEKRTSDRKQLDLKLLFQEYEENPDDPRSLYYIAQTYGCIGDEINKAVYFEKRIAHPVQGYIQEKIDSLFELARTYNFKVNSETKELLTEPLNKIQWKRCEDLYTHAYALDTNRPDGLYFIGIHYYLEGNYPVAHHYFKKGMEIGYPINSQYSLKPTLSFHFLPKFLTETSYYLEDYQTGLAAATLFLQNNQSHLNLMNSWYRIHQQLVKMPPVMENVPLGPIFCIVTDGGWEPWCGQDIETKGLGGSETWIIKTADFIQKGGKYNVVVFCKTDKLSFYHDVGYNPIELFHKFIATTVVDIVIVSRFTEYVPVALKGLSKSVGVIFHDNLLPEMIIPKHPKLKCLLGLSKWHAENIKNVFPQFDVKFSYYGIDNSPLKTQALKVKNSFIYSSFPNRGLVILLRMWPEIVGLFPDSTLNIYCNLEQDWVNQVAPEQMKEIKETIKYKGIKVHGWVSKSVLAEAQSKSHYWLYPCIFEETFCLTAMEAAISKTIVLTNGLAALSETARHGITIPGNPWSTEWQQRCLNLLFKIMETGEHRSVETNYNWASSLTWKSQTTQFSKLIQN